MDRIVDRMEATSSPARSNGKSENANVFNNTIL